MGNIKNYLKYYWLETYLEREVQIFFKKKGYLKAEYFFAIIEWKNPRFGKTKLSHLKAGDIRTLSKLIHDVDSHEERLRILLYDNNKNRRGIKLATATAILTILYPDDFTVYDIRVRSQWKVICPSDKYDLYPDITDSKEVIELYFTDYFSKVKTFANKNKMSLRDCDRALWAKSWRDDLSEFLKRFDIESDPHWEEVYFYNSSI